MTSGKTARRQRRVQAPPPVRAKGAPARREASPKVLAIALGAIALVVAAIIAAFAFTGGSSGTTTPSPLPDSSAAASLFRGIPQHGNVLGSPNAPVTMIEYIDLQCPSCRAFETDVMPSIVSKYVRTGKVKVEARPIVIIGPDSDHGARGAIAAARQNKLFTFSQILYYNQGAENGGWLTDQTVANAASGIAGLRLSAFLKAYDSAATKSDAKRFNNEADADKVSGTPTVYVLKNGGPRTEVTPGYIPSVSALSAALDKALKS